TGRVRRRVGRCAAQRGGSDPVRLWRLAELREHRRRDRGSRAQSCARERARRYHGRSAVSVAQPGVPVGADAGAGRRLAGARRRHGARRRRRRRCAFRRAADRGLQPRISRGRDPHRTAPALRDGGGRPLLPARRRAPPAVSHASVRALVSGRGLARTTDDEHLRPAAVVRRVRRLAVLRPDRRRAGDRPRARRRRAGSRRAGAGTSVDDGDLHRRRRRHRHQQLLRLSDPIADRIRHPRRSRRGLLRDAVIFRDLEYIAWAKSQPPVAINLARGGVEPCPVWMLRVRAADLVVSLPVKYGYQPLREAIASRYGVAASQVFPLSGGTSFANWVAALALLDGSGFGAEVIVERPTYEPLLRIPQALGHRVRRLDRRFDDGYAIDPDRFASLVTARTRLAIVTNLHNPSGARIPEAALRAMAALLARVKGFLLVDEVYLECLFGSRPASCVHAG